jgi:parallel beta-helix repeat protein
MRSHRIRVLTAPLLAATLLACNGESTTPDPVCGKKVGEACAGVSLPEICSGDYCTEGASCAKVLHVRAGASAGGDGSSGKPLATLAAAAAVATSGDCVAIAAGAYAPALFKGGVSLLGKGAQHVTVSSKKAWVPAIELSAGKGGLVRGLTLAGDGRGLEVRDVSGLRVEQVKVDRTWEAGIDARRCSGLVLKDVHVNEVRGVQGGAYGIGLLIADKSRVAVTTTLVEQCQGPGIFASEASVRVRDSAVLGSGRLGLAIECSTATTCKTALASTVDDSLLDKNRLAGLWIKAGKVTARGNEISGTTGWSGAVARAVEAQGGAQIALEKNKIHENTYLGILLDGSTGTLTANTVEGNDERGIWAQNCAGGSLLLDGNTVSGNKLAGIGATGCAGLTVKGGKISGTREMAVADSGGGVAKVSDGLQLLEASDVVVDGVTVETNKRVGVVIDNARATVKNTTITGSKTAIVTQNHKPADVTFSNNKGAGGAAIQPTVPSSALVVNASTIGLISISPIPIP